MGRAAQLRRALPPAQSSPFTPVQEARIRQLVRQVLDEQQRLDVTIAPLPAEEILRILRDCGNDEDDT